MYESHCCIFYNNLAVFWGSSLAIAVAKRVKFCAIYYTLQPEFVPGASRLPSLFLLFIL